MGEVAFGFDDPDEPPYTLQVARITLVSDGPRSAAEGFWSPTLLRPIWVGGGARSLSAKVPTLTIQSALF